MKNSIDSTGNGTRNPPPNRICSAVPQPAVPPRLPKIVHNSCVCGVRNLAALSNQLFRSAIHWLRTARLPFSGHLLMSCNRAPSSNHERPADGQAGRPPCIVSWHCLRRLDVSVATVPDTHTRIRNQNSKCSLYQLSVHFPHSSLTKKQLRSVKQRCENVGSVVCISSREYDCLLYSELRKCEHAAFQCTVRLAATRCGVHLAFR